MKIDWDSPRTEHTVIVIVFTIMFLIAVAIGMFGPQIGG